MTLWLLCKWLVVCSSHTFYLFSWWLESALATRVDNTWGSISCICYTCYAEYDVFLDICQFASVLDVVTVPIAACVAATLLGHFEITCRSLLDRLVCLCNACYSILKQYGSLSLSWICVMAFVSIFKCKAQSTSQEPGWILLTKLMMPTITYHTDSHITRCILCYSIFIYAFPFRNLVICYLDRSHSQKHTTMSSRWTARWGDTDRRCASTFFQSPITHCRQRFLAKLAFQSHQNVTTMTVTKRQLIN